MAKSKKWQYGRDPNPTSWHEAADVIKGLSKKSKPKADKEKK